MQKEQIKRYPSPKLISGCDEAGRGCLAGPVSAAAVILPTDFYHPLLNDSKKLREKHREELRAIIEAEALAWAVAFIDNKDIDRYNILRASIMAMHKALKQLQMQPELIIVDGNHFSSYNNIAYQCIIKGDGKFLSIAAASVLAKTHRDDYMKWLHAYFPEYNWMANKGYPTKAHREAIENHGLTSYHRITYANFAKQKKIQFRERE